jgi:hypothetical protein
MKAAAFVFTVLLVPALTMAATGQRQAYLNQEAKLGVTYNPFAVAKMAVAGKPGFAKCVPLKGTKVLVIGEHSYKGIPGFFSRVKILDGRCHGESGWVETAKLSAVHQ